MGRTEPRPAALADIAAAIDEIEAAPTAAIKGQALERLIRRLTPLDKAKLYDDGTVPEGINSEEKKLLRVHIPTLRDEHRDQMMEFENFVCASYEGRRGASARGGRGNLHLTTQMSPGGNVKVW